MAGHSKWANIQHRKGKQDKLRSKLFSKLSKEITVAAKMGDPDPDKNPRLRLAVKEARSSSMPRDVIDRAIKKSQGGEAEAYESIRYEGYGPGGVAVIVEALTDNRNRTASNVRSTFTKNGGNLGETNSVAFQFERKGEIFYKPDAGDADAVMMGASFGFATPIGYQCNLLVYGPGGYKFSDFLKVGIPLNILAGLVASLVIPLIWDL